MMRKLLSLIFFFFFSSIAFGQGLRLQIAYSNLHSQQFDQLIGTYNFSRPFLEEPQPLLNHSFQAGLSYIFQSDKVLKSGIALNYSLMNSSAENPNLDVKLIFNLWELGYFVQYQNQERFGAFYSELGVNAAFGILHKEHNEEPFLADDLNVRSYQGGVSLNLNVGYNLEFGDKFIISPFLGFNYAPYFMEGESEIVINQTSDLISEEDQYTSFFKFDIGFRVNLTK
jgi:hypothetical protein